MQVGLELIIILPQHSEYCAHRHATTYLGYCKALLTFIYLVIYLLIESVCVYTCHRKSVDIGRQFAGAGSLLPYGTWGIKLRSSDMVALPLDSYLITINISCTLGQGLGC